MTWAVVAASGGQIGGGLVSSFIGGNASKQAANQRAEAIRAATAEERRQYEDTAANLKPYREFGAGQLNEFNTWLHDPTQGQPAAFVDPGMKFRLDTGVEAVEGSAAGRGMLKSGDTLRALTKYGQDMGSQEYNNAFNRYQQESNRRLGLTNVGQTASVQQGNFGQHASDAIADLMVGGGEAKARGTQERGQMWSDFASGTGQSLGNALGAYLGRAKKPPTPGGADSANAKYNPTAGTL